MYTNSIEFSQTFNTATTSKRLKTKIRSETMKNEAEKKNWY